MGVAQRLYESGLITYMRTDSVNMSQVALKQIYGLVEKKFGKEYLALRVYSKKARTPKRRTKRYGRRIC